MKVITRQLKFDTTGAGDLKDITAAVSDVLAESGLKSGSLTVFVVGSTAAITTFEYEPGLIRDVQELYERLAPKNRHYLHDDTWNDANGFSHLRASLAGPGLTIPFEGARLFLGPWQQVVLAEFDNRPRERTVVVQMICT